MVDFMFLRNRVFKLRIVQIWISAVLEVGRSADIHEFCFQGAKRSDMDSVDVQVGLLLIVRMAFSRSKRSDKSSTFLKWDDLLMLRYYVSTVRNDDILAVLSSY